jgi:outer membrane lipopolysaccharide assembly protein LptE/RlpB
MKIRTFILAMTLALTGCQIKYSFNGANIPVEAKTFSVAYFPNNAQMVAPILSQTMTEALVERMERQTRLVQTNADEGGDLAFEGEITGYDSRPSSVSGDQVTTENRLTITVRVQFTNAQEPQYNYSKSFSAYAPYPTSQALQEAEGTLIPEIVEDLVNQIFNAAVANW